MIRKLGLGLLLWAAAWTARADLTVYYVRHAEGGHNVKKDFVARGVPKDQWPAWVGNPDVFTPTGEVQALALATNMPPVKFDLIAVSPLWRTRHTILPYLKAAGRTAEIWPELTETQGFDPAKEGPAAPVIPDFLAGGDRINLPPEEQPYFHLRPDPNGGREFRVATFAEATALARRVERLLRERTGAKPMTVLLVGHGNSGLTLVRQLTRKPAFSAMHLKNTWMWLARETPGGAFELLRYNEPATAFALAAAAPVR